MTLLFGGSPLERILAGKLRDALRAASELPATAFADGAPDPVAALTAGFAPEMPVFAWESFSAVVSTKGFQVVAAVRVPVTGDSVVLESRPNDVFLGGFTPTSRLMGGFIESDVRARAVSQQSIQAHRDWLQRSAERYLESQRRVVARWLPDALSRVASAVSARRELLQGVADLQSAFVRAPDGPAAPSSYDAISDDELLAALAERELPTMGDRTEWIVRLLTYDDEMEARNG